MSEHEQHDVVIVMFSGRPSLIYSLAGLSRAAWDTEEDQTLIEIFRLMNICWIVKIVLINLYAIIIYVVRISTILILDLQLSTS